MKGDYICYYPRNSGKMCGRGCRDPAGCYEHQNSKERVPCKVCGKPTSSEPELCRKHAGGYYVVKSVRKKKLHQGQTRGVNI